MEQPVDKPPFDERAALEELERLRRNIESYRARRRELGEEFEAFIRGFRATRDEWDRSAARLDVPEAPAPDAEASLPERAVAAPAASPVHSLPDQQTVTSDVPLRQDSLTARSIEPPVPPAFDDIEVPRPAHSTADVAAAFDEPAPTPLFADDAPRKSLSKRAVVVAAAAVILLVAAVFVTQRSPSPTPAEPEGAPPAVAPAAAPPQPQATAPPPAPVSTGTELVTTGRAWVRLTVDGARLFERELAAGTRVPINAKQSIVIRTGDAGAVRLTIRGVEQPPLGRAGDVVTRAFKVPPPR